MVGEDTQETTTRELLSQILRELREERADREERDRRLDQRICEIEEHLANLEREMALIGQATVAQGEQLGVMTKQCAERLTVCRGDRNDRRKIADPWVAEDGR